MQSNFIIIGSGIAGLNLALNASKKGKVLVITKKKTFTSNTNRAQGGIAAVLDKTDNFEKHIKDTLEAGAFHNNKKVVEFVVKRAPRAIQKLINLGLAFTTKNGKLDLGQEGGHSQRRIAHVGDFTGEKIEKILVKKARENKNITIWENTFALDLIIKNKICYGVQIIRNGQIDNIYANSVIIATGSIGQLYEYTTNESIATGDGIAMAVRNGCKIEDIEFIQFHPTVLDKKMNPMFLLSEALRGEGAILVSSKGKKFIKNDLAPRDIVSRAIYEEQKKEQVYLDISHKDPETIKTRFPNIYKQLLKYGYDLTKEKIPISPGVHYSCGGVKINLHGQTCIKNLYATGEVACTGVHGANRLASNSLLEALVFSEEIIPKLKPGKIHKLNWPKPNITEEKALKVRTKIKKLMWEYAGVVKTETNLKILLLELKKLENLLPPMNKTNINLAETRNMLLVANLIAKASLKRKKNLGCHHIKN